jgi:hypothetical protein
MRRRSVPHLSHANRRAVTRLRGLLAALVVSAAVIAMLPAGSACKGRDPVRELDQLRHMGTGGTAK